MVPVMLFIFTLCLSSARAVDNGLALTPPMGWMSWQRFRCVTNCTLYPTECINEDLIRSMADRMAEDGYLEAGYEYVIIDDCWLARERDADGKLQPDPERFPSGIKALADYVHDRGLKFGIYEDYGTNTCAGYPGILGNLELDVNTFAEWGADYLKLDGCYAELEGMEEGYGEVSHLLNQTGRPIVFSCSFPAYEGLDTNYTAAVEYCNLWRNYDDIMDSWASVTEIVEWFAENQDYLATFAGPGHWNDPDMLIIGNYGLSFEQSKSQMTIWSLMAAPLLMSVDLRSIEPNFRDILLNRDAISINQDPLGIPGKLDSIIDDIAVWKKPVNPIVDGEYTYGLGFVSNRDDGIRYMLEVSLEQFGLNYTKGYTVELVFEATTIPTTILPQDPLQVFVKPSGAVLLRIIPVGA